jgi:serine/threonine protein kinase
MKTPKKTGRQTFLARLRHSGLVPRAELVLVLPRLPNTTHAQPTAHALVEMGVLTPFQAERLLAGRSTGLRLGQYRILEQIGGGGMGMVFKAEHRTMRRIVALKMLNSDLLESARAVQLFLHEVRAVARLIHPNIVTAYDANEVSGRYYLVLEFVDGPDLDQLVRAHGLLPVGLACDYARQVANGLQCAHALGMVHRDIKPANILVQRQGPAGESSPGLVKISDFGLARLHAPAHEHPVNGQSGTILTLDNAVMGTPDYLSPEQARCLHKTDIRSDLYSLGCTLYFLLTGQPPFPGGNALDKLVRHANEQPAPITAVRRDVPVAVLAIADKLMAKRREERFQTPAELAEALSPHAVGGPLPWPRSSGPVALTTGAATNQGGSSCSPNALEGTTSIYRPVEPGPGRIATYLRSTVLRATTFVARALGVAPC